MPKVNIRKKILSVNEEYAFKNARFLTGHRILCLNMISSPGSGKTTILTRTINELKNQTKIGVIEGDIQTDFDAKKIRTTKPPIWARAGGWSWLSLREFSRSVSVFSCVDDLDLI